MKKPSRHPSCGWVKAVLVPLTILKKAASALLHSASAAIAGELARHNNLRSFSMAGQEYEADHQPLSEVVKSFFIVLSLTVCSDIHSLNAITVSNINNNAGSYK